MSKVNAPVVTFNGGLVSRLALARVDVSRLKFAAELQDNWVPRTLGPMMLRPGLRYIGATRNNEQTEPLPFVFSHDDKAIVELAGGYMRVRGSDEALVTREAVATTIENGDFADPSGWTLTNIGGATSSIDGTHLNMSATALGSRVVAEQVVTVAGGDADTEHGLRIVIVRGPVKFRIGTSSGGDDVVSTIPLPVGEHSLAIIPGATTLYLQFESAQRRKTIVAYCQVESAGVMEISIPWLTADFAKLRIAQSGDVLFVACRGYQQRRIERRSGDSWSLVLYQSDDGPFRPTPSEDVSITPSGTFGNITLAASASLFRPSMIGGLLRLFQTAQTRIADISAENTFSDPIRLSGVSGVRPETMTFWDNGLTTNPNWNGGGPAPGTRSFFVEVHGTWVGQLTLQRSFDSAETGFSDIPLGTSGPFAVTYTDEFDNSIVWYRIGFKTGDYSSGTATVTLQTPNGAGPGIVRITDVSSPTLAGAEVLESITPTTSIGTLHGLSSIAPTKNWQEGEWSERRGFPAAVALTEGRLWWFGQDRIWGSISDAYNSFNIDFPGDAGPINRSIGYGPVEVINWALPLQRLVLGLQCSEASVRSSNFDQPLSPTNFSIKDCSTQGSAPVPPAKIDTRGVFVQQSRRRLYQVLFHVEENEYNTNDLTSLRPDVDADFTQVVVQRQPDTRIHVLRSDGTVDVLLFEPKEEVLCWSSISTDGVIERMVVLPGDVEDAVYYYVRRVVDGQTVRYLERFALISDCQGGDLNHQADAYVVIAQASSATITGLSHLEGEDVVVWANSKDLGTYTVSGGNITVSEAVTTAIVGLPYTARFKSAKLAYGGQLGTALSQRKRIEHLGLILHNTHAQGLEFSGKSFDRMDNLPLTYKGTAVDTDRVYGEFDEPMVTVPGTWDTDSRLYLRATAPRPATVLGAVVGMSTHDKA